MPINHHEIIEDMEGHIRKCGGAWGEWCVGTAKDSHGMFFRRHREADPGDGVTYREAFTTDAAQAEVTHLVNERGLEPDRGAATEAERRSALYLSPAERHTALPPPPSPVKSFSSTAKL
jgi:hypothetical protein